ncbi:MAG: hypothetical protein II781_04925, partial [Clostridia bacterium]|nr:hypothetical protein [Clostridia bacterium]
MESLYTLLTDPSDESKPLIRLEDSPEDIKKAIRKAMRVWDKRTSATGEAQQKAEQMMLWLTEARQTLTDPESKKAYDEKLAEQEAEQRRLEEEERRLRQQEEEERRKQQEEANRERQRILAEQRRKAEEERKRLEEQRREEQRRREEEARRALEEERARQAKKRPLRGGVVSFVLNFVLILVIAWAVVSWGHLVPKKASLEPVYLLGEYNYLTGTDTV